MAGQELELRRADSILKDSLSDFKLELDDRKHDRFFQERVESLEIFIFKAQKTQETLGELMNWGRMGPVLSVFKRLELSCNRARLGNESSLVSGYLWGPVRFVLETTSEDRLAFDTILDAYERLGTAICLLRHNDGFDELPSLMYKDVLEFHRTVIQFIGNRGWKKTWKANWLDYDTKFGKVLDSFKNQARLLQLQKRVDATQLAVNGHVQRYEEDQEQINGNFQDMQDHFQDFRRHAQRYEEDQEQINGNFRDMQDHIQDSRRHVQRYEEDQERAAQLDEEIRVHHEETRRLIDQYMRDRAADSVRDAEAEEERKNEQYLEVHRWLSGSQELQASYHDKFQQIRNELPGTSTWILRVDKIWNWIHAEVPTESILRVVGQKGAGKTVLSSSIIDECSKKKEALTSYFYFRDNDPAQNNLMSMCKTILQQMLEQCRDVLAFFNDHRHDGETLGVRNKAYGLLEAVCERNRTQFIIIDGLDECVVEEQKVVIQLLVDLVEAGELYRPGKLRILLMGTAIQDMKSQPKALQTATIFEIETRDVIRDIEALANQTISKLRNDPTFESITEDVLAHAKQLICDRSNGMFLFARVASDSLIAQQSVLDLKKALEDGVFPKRLRDAYEKVLTGLQEKLSKPGGERQWEKAKKIFGLLASAKRPLLWRELQAALALPDNFQVQDLRIFRDGQLRDEIHYFCGSLVHVYGNRRLEFIHQTARIFVLQSGHLTEGTIECDLAVMCVGYLGMPMFASVVNQEARKTFVENGFYALQDYAISKWHRHIEAVLDLAVKSDILADGSHIRAHFRVVLADFVKRYGGSMKKLRDKLSKEKKDDMIRDAEQDATRRTLPLGDWPDLKEVVFHITLHHKQTVKERSKISLEDLATGLTKTREVIWDLYDRFPKESKLGTEWRENLARFYGTRLHKCERVGCDLFYDGFADSGPLKKHIKRHDRPFECPVERCHLSHLAFVSASDRDKHIVTYHPTRSDQLSVAGGGAFAQPRRRPPEAFAHKCDIDGCGRSFTRKANLRAHQLNHFGERPHVCTTCGRAFTRISDRTRHDKAKHLRRA